jgi:DtxR family transcriptional regulator, Mn-dependent transcriptional regulator
VSSTTENYLKNIFAVSESSDNELVGLGELAQALGVTPGTVTTMMKSLCEAGLVDYRPRAGVRLTEVGRRQALDVVRRHRLIELFLVEVLKLDWADVHDEAEVLEHAISDRLLGRIDEILGFPTSDPHGDPIPDSSGRLPRAVETTLADVEPPASVRIVRVEHEESRFLDFLKSAGLVPGAEIELVERNRAAGTIWIAIDGTPNALSLHVAQKLRVERKP